MATTPTTQNTGRASNARARRLQRVTLHDFYRLEGRGAQKRMSTALGVSKGTLSAIAAADRPVDPGRRVYVSYSLARKIKGYLETAGYTLDIEPLLRTEDAAP